MDDAYGVCDADKGDDQSVEDDNAKDYEEYETYYCMKPDYTMVDQGERRDYNQEFSAFYADPNNMYEMVPVEHDDCYDGYDAYGYGDFDDETGQGT